MTVEAYNKRNTQHEDQVDYVLTLLDVLNHDSERMPFVYKGPDIELDNTWIEVKSWDQTRPSYREPKYWRRLCYSKIQCKSDGTPGICTNTLETPVEWRDYLRSKDIYPVFLDPNETEQKNLQKLKMALLWVGSLHYIGTRDIDLSQFEIKFLLSDILPPFEIKYEDQLIKDRELYLFSLIKTKESARGL